MYGRKGSRASVIGEKGNRNRGSDTLAARVFALSKLFTVLSLRFLSRTNRKTTQSYRGVVRMA